MAQIIRNEELDAEGLAKLSRDEVYWVYNALDCCVALEVYRGQQADMDDIARATARFSNALMAPVFEMTLRGVLINQNKVEEVLTEFTTKHAKIERNLKRIVIEGVGLPAFNPRSVPQLKNLFYNVLDLKPVLKRNANGRYLPSTDRDAIEKLSKYHIAQPFCSHLLALRDLEKKISFLSTEIDPDGRMRTSYNIAGTNTGRLSSSASDFGTGTNNQNITRSLREIFVPDPGMKFCNIDLEQADARNVGAINWQLFVDATPEYLAELAGVEKWEGPLGPELAGAYLDACESGDLHTTVCKMAWSHLEWNPDNLRETADQIAYRDFSYRDLSKKLGHGTNFVGTPRTMAMHTKMPVPIIDEFQKNYFRGFPSIPLWHKWVQQQLESSSQIITPFYNRRRIFFGRPDDAATLREAVAYAPQSMTADAIDQGILNLFRSLPQIQLLIQVHDSILFQYPETEEQHLVPRALELLTITHELKHSRKFSVPVEAKIGWNWGDADLKKQHNLDGLVKWKGPGADERKRPIIITERKKLTLEDVLKRSAKTSVNH